ncbi:hypothetical protein PPL_04510 [Heterostelium album PN500]|uniref:PH domain-containing protein n=1 Tax=Heterostelium pallidum (strain ATCC 26659 / Pp 5 / PN500) TaxID=670386 RepID=D3B7S2_HETP5|nr:hypothetical protein PPL_04510 [Heterostelium album PN500]EFA82815.1 hypothetical protein PPL_04510 [Heterostelium album PN500]|eukprot:XP_020434932.1 hypothetical protein PPL_04510 [Heterostelium album PN500]
MSWLNNQSKTTSTTTTSSSTSPKTDKMEPHTTVTYEGILDVAKKSSLHSLKYKNSYVRLVPGGLYVYRTEQDDDFKCVDIEFAMLDITPANNTRPHTFSVRNSSNKVTYFSANSQQEFESWTEHVKTCTGKKNVGVPMISNDGAVKREGRTDVLFRAKKNISGKIASSGVGKSGLKKLIPEEGRELISSVKKIIRRVSSEDKANEIEKNIIKILVKVFFQIDSKTIELQDLAKVDKALREAFNNLDRAFRFYGVKKSTDLMPIFEKVSQALKDAENESVLLFSPYLRPHNIQKMRTTFAFIGSTEFFSKVWDDMEIEDDLFLLVSALNKYTQIEIIH